MSIAENRHHRARVLANRCKYNMASKQPYKMIKTPCLCSCWMCCAAILENYMEMVMGLLKSQINVN